jgi:hypothetical protein
MTQRPRITVVNVGDRSTNFWVVSAARSHLPVDLRWPGMFGTLLANVKRMDVPIERFDMDLQPTTTSITPAARTLP